MESTIRVVTWNVWGRHGEDWEDRQAAIEDVLVEVDPDVVCLVEAWGQGDTTQPELIAKQLGLTHHLFVGGWEVEEWISGLGFVSRWPMSEPVRRPLRNEDGSGFGEAVHVVVDGGRGPIQLFIAVLDYPLDASALRQAQSTALARFVSEVARRRYPTVVCGDFNAGPDSDEIRMLTGRSAPAAPGLRPVNGTFRFDGQSRAGRSTTPSAFPEPAVGDARAAGMVNRDRGGIRPRA